MLPEHARGRSAGRRIHQWSDGISSPLPGSRPLSGASSQSLSLWFQQPPWRQYHRPTRVQCSPSCLRGFGAEGTLDAQTDSGAPLFSLIQKNRRECNARSHSCRWSPLRALEVQQPCGVWYGRRSIPRYLVPSSFKSAKTGGRSDVSAPVSLSLPLRDRLEPVYPPPVPSPAGRYRNLSSGSVAFW